MITTVPISIKIAFVDQIESAAQGWKDGIQSHAHFLDILNRMALNIYKAGVGHHNTDIDED